MLIKVLLSLTLTLVFVAQAQKSDAIDITEESVSANWEKIRQYLNAKTSFVFDHQGLTEATMLRILSQPFPHLSELYFHERDSEQLVGYLLNHQGPTQKLTPKLLKAIFESEYFPHLRVLDLKDTNIDQRYFNFLENNTVINATLQEFGLINCLIGKRGFQMLSNINFQGKLVKLKLSETLLIQSQAVDAVMSMICSYDNEGICHNQVKQFQISHTNIQRADFIKLISILNSTTLQTLSLDGLTLIYEQTYNDGSNYTAYQFLASNNFSALKQLFLFGNQINDEIAFIFQNWTLPSLEVLDIGHNHIADEGFRIWVTKQNMPNLNSLAIYSNLVGDGFINHLKEEQFELKKLRIGDCKMTNLGYQSLSGLKTSKLQLISFQLMNIGTKYIVNFFDSAQFPKLKYLIFESNQEMSTLFAEINWKKWMTVQKIIIQQCNIAASIGYLVSAFLSKIDLFVLPNLSQFQLINNHIDPQIMGLMSFIIPKYFPNIKIVLLQQQDSFVMVDVNSLLQAGYKQGTLLNFQQYCLVKNGNAFDVLKIHGTFFLFALFDSQIKIETIQNLKITSQSLKHLNLQPLTELGLMNRYDIEVFFKMMEAKNLQSLPKLRQLIILFQMNPQDIFQKLKTFQLNSISTLLCKLLVPADATDQYIEKQIIPFLQQFDHLFTLKLDLNILNQQQSIFQRQKIFDNIYYPFLNKVIIQQQNLQLFQVKEFLTNHNLTIRQLAIENNFLEKGFFSILVETDMILAILVMSSMSFTAEEFSLFGNARTEFIQKLYANQNDLTNEHIFRMIEQNGAEPLFPKLSELHISNNNIRKQGLEALMKTQLFDITILIAQGNPNPHFLNLILKYPTKIGVISAIGGQIYGLESNIHPDSVKNVRILQIKTKSFIKEDFDILAKLSFKKLSFAAMQIINVYDCEILKDLLYINRQSWILQLYFLNDHVGLNSECITNTNFSSHINNILIFDAYSTIFIPQFVVKLLGSNIMLQFLFLDRIKTTPEAIKDIFANDFSELKYIIFRDSMIGDTAFKSLLKSELKYVNILSLENTDITDISIKELASVDLANLQILLLNENDLSENSIEYIGKLKVTEIKSIELMHCGLTGTSLNIITSYTFSNLQTIKLDYNNFNEEDIVDFVANIERNNLPVLQYLGLKGVSLSRKYYDEVVKVLQTKNIKYGLDAPHNLPKINSAKY